MTIIQLFISRRDRNNTLRWLVVLILGLALTYLAIRQYAPFLGDPDALRVWVEQFGILSPLVFIGLQAAQVIVAPVPGQVVVLLGGYLFGTVPGTAYSLVGATVGSTVVFWLSRRYGRSYVERVVTPGMVARFDGFTRDHALTGMLVAFLIPGFPDDVLCFVGGLTEVRLWKLVAVSFVGRIPSYALVSFVGVELANENFATVLVLIVVSVALAVLSYRYRDRLLDRFGG